MGGKFYKKIDDEWFSVSIVTNINYHLCEDNKDDFEYPLDGWEWFDEPPVEYLEWIDFINIDIDIE